MSEDNYSALEHELDMQTAQALRTATNTRDVPAWHCMIDLETLSHTSKAAILAIGAVKFDPQDPTRATDRFYCVVDPESSQQMGGEISASTVKWWMQQRDEARQVFTDPDAIDLPSALVGFLEWYGETSLPTWSNGATFDLPIMEYALQRCGFTVPWQFRHQRCVRTITALAPVLRVKPAIAHHALADAAAQVETLQAVAARYGLVLG